MATAALQTSRFAIVALVAATLGAAPNFNQPDSRVVFTDITASTGITFTHVSAPEKKYIVESMSGGVGLFDFDKDGWLDVYLVNSPTVATAGDRPGARSALWRNNHDGTFTDVTERAGVGYPGWAMGVATGDYDNDGWEDLYVTCFGANHLFRNNGDGTFTDVTARAGVGDSAVVCGGRLRRLRQRRKARPFRRELHRSEPRCVAGVRWREELPASVELPSNAAPGGSKAPVTRSTTTTATGPSPTSQRRPASRIRHSASAWGSRGATSTRTGT